MQNTSFLKLTLVALVAVFFASCDKDYNEVGSDIIGEDHFGLEKDSLATVVAYNQSTGAVQSNNLPVNALGYYNNPTFGKTKASFLTQVELIAANPTFGINPTITKVELSLPYYSTLTETLDDGNHNYELDSIYGSSKFKLGVYESNYYLRDYDAATGFQEVQKYYSDQAADFTVNPTRLNDDAVSPSQNDEFFFSNSEIITYKIVDGEQVVDTRSAPGMRLRLNAPFFQNKIFGAGAAGKLVNNNTFKEYFRGLYFKVDNAASSVNQGSLAMLNFKQGKVTITYAVAKLDTDGDPVLDGSGNIVMETDTDKLKTLVINLGGNTVNVFENEYNATYLAGISSPNTTDGDPLLYLKGQAGSMTVIELFGNTDVKKYEDGTFVSGSNGVSDELEDWRHPADGKQRLINEANLTFTVNKAAMAGTPEPNRIYLYDLNNRRPLIDYYSDNSISANPKFNKLVHGGIIEKETTGDKRGIRYRIRLTNHIRNLIKNDSTNVRLGLVVTEDIKTTTSAKRRTPTDLNVTPVHPLFSLDRVPLSSVLNPLGTVLYGSSLFVQEDKRLKLKIYYTQPN